MSSYTKYHKAYYENHRDELKKAMSVYQKEYYQKNRERILNRVKEYQRKKAEEGAAQAAAPAPSPEN